MSATTLQFNPAVQTWPFDGAAREPMLLCEVPRADGSAARFVLPARLVQALRHFDGGRPTADAARDCARDGACPPEALERLVRDFLVPRGILVDPAAPAAEPERKADRLSYLTFRTRLLSPRLVTPVARRLAWLFSPTAAAAGLLLVVAAHLFFYLRLIPGHSVALWQIRGEHAAAAVLVMIASTVVHEFGHAAAAARYGCRRLEIGWGMYYHMSVLYTDLSEAWRLPRKQRAVIDVGGMYFQALFSALLLGVYLATGSPVPLYAFIATDFAIGSSLNPFFRMDGYWLVSDLMGIPNLHAQGTGILQRGAVRLLGRRRPVEGPPLPVGRLGAIFLAAYSVFGLAFFLFAFTFALRRLVFGIATAYPQVLAGFWTALTAQPPAFGTLGMATWDVLWRSLVLFGTARFTLTFITRVARGLHGLVRLLVRSWRPEPSRPAVA